MNSAACSEGNNMDDSTKNPDEKMDYSEEPKNDESNSNEENLVQEKESEDMTNNEQCRTIPEEERIFKTNFKDNEILQLTRSEQVSNYYIFLDAAQGNLPQKKPFEIKREIERKIRNPNIESIRYTKNNKLLVCTQSVKTAMQCLNISKFFEINIRTRLVRENLITKHLIRGIDYEVSMKDLVKEINCENNIVCLEAVRLTRYDQQTNKKFLTMTVLLTVLGHSFRDKIKIADQSFDLVNFTQRPNRCWKCQDFGHRPQGCTKYFCKRCGAETYLHGGNPCISPIKCKNCGLEHEADDTHCDRYVKEKKVLQLAEMNKIPVFEARRLTNKDEKYSEKRETFSYITKKNSQNDEILRLESENELLREELKIYRDDMKTCKSEIKEMREQIKFLVDMMANFTGRNNQAEKELAKDLSNPNETNNPPTIPNKLTPTETQNSPTPAYLSVKEITKSNKDDKKGRVTISKRDAEFNAARKLTEFDITQANDEISSEFQRNKYDVIKSGDRSRSRSRS